LPAPSATAPAAAFDFGDTGSRGLGRVRVRARIAGAVSWLRATVAVDVVASIFHLMLFGFVIPHPVGALFFILIGLIVFAVFLYAPLTVIAFGAGSLAAQRRYGLVITAAVLSFLVGLLTLAQAGVLVLAALANSSVGPLLAGLLAGLGTACAIVAGVKTLLVLQNPEVKKAFH
jgi:hypothetical protein